MYSDDRVESNSGQKNEAVLLYTNRTIKGTVERAIHFFRGKPVHLIDLNSFLRSNRVLGSHHLGIRSVAVDQIRGSEGRSEDFDRSFNPIEDRTRTRWLNVARARLAGRELPPVELIQIGEVHFVRDGHHRISVARALGEKYMDAEVTKWEVQPLAPASSISCKAPRFLLAGQCV
jgi:hypothetical protein